MKVGLRSQDIHYPIIRIISPIIHVQFSMFQIIRMKRKHKNENALNLKQKFVVYERSLRSQKIAIDRND